MGKALVLCPPKESTKEHLPEIFLKPGYGECLVTIHCAVVFIDRLKSLSAQAATWSDYKYHNPFKFLVGITPTGFILFLTSCYRGQANDKFITRDSGFYDLLEKDDEVMADRGFQIQEDLLFFFADWLFRLVQESEAKETNKLANCVRTINPRKEPYQSQ